MDLSEELIAAKMEREQHDAEVKARRAQRDLSEAAHHAWERAAGMMNRCYDAQEDSIPAALDAIRAALQASELAGELASLRRIAAFWLEHAEVFIFPARIVATIVMYADWDRATILIRQAIEARVLNSVADSIEAIGEVTWHGHDPEVFYAHVLKQHYPAPIADLPAVSVPPVDLPGPTAGQIDTPSDAEGIAESTRVERPRLGVGGRPRKWEKLDELISKHAELTDEEIVQRHNSGNWKAIELDPTLKATKSKVKERRTELNRQRKPSVQE